MTTITLKGDQVKTLGSLPQVGELLPDFELVKNNLGKTTLKDYKGFNLVLNIFPSLDTGTCAASVRRFNKEAANFKNTKVLCISRDLPFAQKRFCGAEGIENVETLSDFQTGKFGKDYNLEMISGSLAHLHSRVVIVADKEGQVVYTEQVPEITSEPNYDKAIAAVEKLK